MRGTWGRVFIEPFNQFKWWVVRVTEPWREEKAALDLEWKAYAQKKNAAGERPRFWYPGVELDPMGKVELMDLDTPPLDPDYLIKMQTRGVEFEKELAKKDALKRRNK